MRIAGCILLLSFLIIQCSEPTYTPKPRGYPRVVYPAKTYQAFKDGDCPFTFDYPAYAVIQKDTAFFDEAPAHPCWFNVYIPAFESRIHCSYAPVAGRNTIDKLKTDAFRMTDWHNKKATYIQETPFSKPNNVKGIIFEVEGPVASQLQFFLTDSLEKKHFLRGALYFYTQARPDSLAPVYDFVKKDVEKMLATFEWKQ